MKPQGEEATPSIGTPRSGHALTMTWSNLAFLHWPVSPGVLAPFVPPELEIDQHGGTAWIGVVPFVMEDVRLRFCPKMPTAHRFPELNLRTYVSHRGRPGVWFFSLDAASVLSVRAARATFSLPYFDASMKVEAKGQGAGQPGAPWTVFTSARRGNFGAPPAHFDGRYRAVGERLTVEPGSLEHFLTERYSLFAQASSPDFEGGVPRGLFGGALRRPLLRGDIAHSPWPLFRGEAELDQGDMFRLIGLDQAPSAEPLVHVSPGVAVKAFAPRAVTP